MLEPMWKPCKTSTWTKRKSRQKRNRAWKKWRRQEALKEISRIGARFISDRLSASSFSKMVLEPTGVTSAG